MSFLRTNVFLNNGGKFEKATSMFGNFNMTMNFSKEFPIDYSLHALFLTQRTFVWKNFPEMTFDWCISFLVTPSLTLSGVNNLESFLSYVASTHLVLLLSLYYPLKICNTQRRSCFVTRTIVINTSHSFKNKYTMIATSVYTETINFLFLFSGSITLNFTVWSNSQKRWRHHVLERTRLVLTRREALGLTLILTSCIQTVRHWLTPWVGIKLTGINSNNRLA